MISGGPSKSIHGHTPAVFAEILTIGDELCRGEIVDTNSSWLAARLWDLGVEVRWKTSCRDDREDLLAALAAAAGRARLVVTSGGLGPTEDDLTVDVLCEALGVEPQLDGPSLERWQARFGATALGASPNSLRQLRAPAGAEILANPAGAAPGFAVTLGGATVFSMPGVPRELHAIFDGAVAPRVTALAAGDVHIVKRIHRVFGRGESQIAHLLEGLVDGVSGTSLHYQVAFPETLVKLVVRDRDGDAARAKLEALDGELRARLGDLAYAVGDESMPLVVTRALRAAGARLAVAESCTGGMLGALLTEVPGASETFVGGWIAYANEIKQGQLGVSQETLEAHGAVSRACVLEMARAARERAGATHALAVSGIAGPGGGTADKPVGTVHVGLAGPAGETHRLFTFPGARDQVRRVAAFAAMALLLKELRRG
jgi:nicotinamide-nucleotide amidase